MVQEDKKIPFPQANDFDKIVKIIDPENEFKLDDKEYMKKILDLGTERQISYYYSACQFLDLIDNENKFTEFTKKINDSCYENKMIKLAQKVISKPVFGEIFLMRYYDCIEYDTNEISQIISDLYGINNIEVCKRRASTVKSWIKWIESKKDIFL